LIDINLHKRHDAQNRIHIMTEYAVVSAFEEVIKEWESILERENLGLERRRPMIAQMFANPVRERRLELAREWSDAGDLRIESSPILSKIAPEDDLSNERLSGLEPMIRRLRKELFHEDAPPLSLEAAGTDGELGSEIEALLEDLKAWSEREIVENAWTKVGPDFSVKDTDDLLGRLTGRSLKTAPRRFWMEIERLSEATGFGTIQLLYRLLTGEDVPLPWAVIEVQPATRKGDPAEVGRALQATVKVYRPLSYTRIREIFERLGGSRRRIGVPREAEETTLRRIVSQSLTGVSNPWSITTWEKHVVPAWKAGKGPTRAASSLLKRYRRMTDRMLKEFDAEVPAPDGRWNEDRWKNPIYKKWIDQGMLDVGWVHLRKRHKHLETRVSKALKSSQETARR
jgi:hypothetical protein